MFFSYIKTLRSVMISKFEKLINWTYPSKGDILCLLLNRKFKMLGEARRCEVKRDGAASESSGIQRRREKELRYENWLEQVTINAVEQALKFQEEESHSQRKDVPQSSEMQGCSPSNQSHADCSSGSRHPICCHHHRGWMLDRNSEERRIVAARIYSLLVKWKPDLSFEWRARVASAVHVFERALYREANTKDEYLNSLMLDLQLRQILRQFEAGTGPALLRKNCAGHHTHGHAQHSSRRPLRKSVSFNSTLRESQRQPLVSYNTPSVEPVGQPVPLGELMRMQDEERRVDGHNSDRRTRPAIDDRNSEDQMRGIEPSLSLQRDQLRKDEADSSLWEVILSGNLKDMEETLAKHRKYASKRVVKRALRMLSKRKREEEKRIEEELRKAMLAPSVQTLVESIARARSEFGEELKDLCNDAEVVLRGLLEDSVRVDTSAPPCVSNLPVAVSENSRRTETETESVSSAAPTAMVASPPSQLPRLCNGIKVRRNVTFSSVERTEPAFQTPSSITSSVDTGAERVRRNVNFSCEGSSEPASQTPNSIISSGDTGAERVRRNVTFSCEGSTTEPASQIPDSILSSGDTGAERVRRNVTFSCEGCTEPASQTPNANYSGVDTGAERAEMERGHHGSLRSGDVPRRASPPPPQALGSLLGWVPPRRASLPGAQYSPPTRHLNQGERTWGSNSSPRAQQSPPPTRLQIQADSSVSNSLSVVEVTISNPSGLTQAPVRSESTSDAAVDSFSSSSHVAENTSQGPRISLMALLHQGGDSEGVVVMNRRRLCSALRPDSSTGDDLSQEMIDVGMDPICCVCMVGKKGAAFIPCGHTFCRKCTRELRKGRGTCPLCNKSIQDVLKIY